MSRSEWERGTSKVPTAAWAPLKKAIQSGMAAHIENDYKLAVALYDALSLMKKGTRNFDLLAAFAKEWDTETRSLERSIRWMAPSMVRKYPFKVMERHQIFQALFGPDAREQFYGAAAAKPAVKLFKPQKQLFAKPTSVTVSFSNNDCDVILNNTTRELTWSVREGNRSIEPAHESALGRLVFGALAKVKWTRDTGGTIVGNDEYNRDQREEGGGGNYVNHRFGPRGELRFDMFVPRRTRKSPVRKATVAKTAAPSKPKI